MSSEGLNFSQNDSKEFIEALWYRITKENLFSNQKSDICDYLLYLFNKHINKDFLDDSNEKNERLLKITASKLKTSKKNIVVKFMNDEEYDQKFKKEFKNLIISRIEGSSLVLVVEDKAFRDILEAKLKKYCNDTLEYRLNSEKVELDFEHFATLVEEEFAGNQEMQRRKKSLERAKIIEGLKEIAKSSASSIARKSIEWLLGKIDCIRGLY